MSSVPPSHPNPFSDDPIQNAPGVSTGRPRLLVVAFFAIVTVIVCGGVGILGLYGYRQMVPPPPVDLSTRSETFEQCLDEFNAALAETIERAKNNESLTTDPQVDVEIKTFVETSIAALEQGDAIAFHRAMFVESVENSAYLENGLNALEKLQLQRWISQTPPLPWGDGTCKILAIRHGLNPAIATADFLLYSEDVLCSSYRWHMVRSQGGWELYDWRNLDFGQSMSDEYAAFMLGDETASGLDHVVDLTNTASSTYDANDATRAQQLLHEAEAVLTLPTDRPAALLHIAYTWLQMDEYEEALRVSESIQSPHQMLGVWPLTALCQLGLENHEAGLVAIERAQALSPHHPDINLLRARLLSHLQRPDAAIAAATLALEALPEDIAAWWFLSDNFGSERLSRNFKQWIPLLVGREDMWLELLPSACEVEDLSSLESLLRSDNRVPRGMSNAAQGFHAFYLGQFETAAGFFLQAEEALPSGLLAMQLAEERFDARLRSQTLPTLIAEGDAPEKAIKRLATWAFSGRSLDGDPSILLRAIENSPQSTPWKAPLLGWLCLQTNRHNSAIDYFDKSERLLRAIQDDEDDSWIAEPMELAHAGALLHQHRIKEIVQHFPKQSAVHEQLGEFLVNVDQSPLRQTFLTVLKKNACPSLQAQRSRLLSIKAIRDGNGAAAMQHHVDAIARLSAAEPYYIESLVAEFASNVAIHGNATTVPTYDSEEYVQQFLQFGLYISASMLDETRYRQWKELAQANDLDSVQFFVRQLELRQGLGQQPEAIELCRRFLAGDFIKSADRESELTDWGTRRAVTHLLQGRAIGHSSASKVSIAMAKKGLDELDDTMPSDATIALAQGKGRKLLKLLEPLDTQTVQNWLQQKRQLHWLGVHGKEPWCRTLLKAYPLRSMPNYPTESLQLLFPPKHRISPAQLKMAYEMATKTAAKVTEIVQSGSQNQAWRLTPESGDRVVISAIPSRIDMTYLGSYLADAAQGDRFLRVTLEWMGDDLSDRRELFTLGRHLASHGAVAVHSERFSLLWSGPGLAEQLNWRGHLPFETARTFDTLNPIGIIPEQELPLGAWRTTLAKGREPEQTHLLLHCETELVSERVPALLVDVDVDTEELSLRPLVDSVVNPWVQSGILYRCDSNQVSRQTAR